MKVQAILVVLTALLAQQATSTTGRKGVSSSPTTCDDAIADTANPLACLQASSEPRLGFLYPLSSSLNVHSSGKIGVGTTSPLTNIHVMSGTDHSLVRVTETGSHGKVAGLQLEQRGTGTGFTIGTGAEDYGGVGGLGIRTFAGETRMVISASGNVGIGTRSPTSKLEVSGELATQTLRIKGGSDIAERFLSEERLAPGSVVALDIDNPGQVELCRTAYSKCVIGVVSGAGGVDSGLVLSQDGVFNGDVKVALLGRVYVQCTAEGGAIEIGDMLTSSLVPGHAMKVDDVSKRSGAILGKAATALPGGKGLVLMVVGLQ